MIGSLVGIKYEILSELDSTPLFSSFRAVDRSNGRDVRIRILESTLSGERRFVDSLNEHVDSLRAINHPALEKIYDVVDENEQYSLICEYVQANNLELRVKRLASFSVQLAISTAISICDGLSAVHQAGVVHGDISGQNILVTPSGAVKLTMTGLWNAYPSSSKAGLVMLKNMAPYMAPEVTSGSMPNNLSDIYSVGIVIYQMLAGRCPFVGDSTVAIATKHASAPYPSLRAINPAVPAALDELVRRCMQKEPSARYQSVSSLLSDLRGIQDALRFGRPLAYPPQGEPDVVQAITPEIEEPVNEVKKKKASKQKTVKRQAGPDDFPRWLTVLVVLFSAVICAALGSWVWFNTHQPKLIDLPSVVNKDKALASEELKKLGLTLLVDRQQASDQYPAGTVISQDPEPGRKKIREKGIVQVVISAGSRFVPVPDLRGRTEEEARQLLASLNLELDDNIEKVRDRELDEGMVVSQIPEPRKKLERGSKVSIRISNGNKRVSDSNEANQRYTYKLKITMPDGADAVVVRIDMTDSRETQTVHEEAHEPNDTFEVECDGFGKEALFRVFFDGELVKQVTKKAEVANQEQ